MSLDLLLDLGRTIADPTTDLGREVRAGLNATHELSPEGVELALREHLETSASPADRRSLEAWCEPSERCLVVLSAHVCVAALRAIALALASAPRVLVRPSRRDPVLASVLVRELARRGVAIEQIEDVRGIARSGDQLHAYGSAEALAAIAHALPPDVRVREHGPGLGAAVIGPHAELEQAATALARDVIVFDQRGCLSPRVVFIAGEQRAEAFGALLHEALSRAAQVVPRSDLDTTTRAELARFRAIAQAVALRLHEERDHTVALVSQLSDLPLPPAARSLLMVHADPPALRQHLMPLLPWLTCVGISDETAASWVADALHPHVPPRLARLGEMQRPPLDGPVDQRRPRAPAPSPPIR